VAFLLYYYGKMEACNRSFVVVVVVVVGVVVVVFVFAADGSVGVVVVSSNWNCCAGS
jgi:hypothetical protein